ncbi:SDR family NAD(P)-dependent oxidoreductase [Umezawaea sp. Da 62-37]|uniref:SDR family NAD(P)-dependent oxidoreductase n=1 Tax=Umezawaea sp. Da 62-37 TaxID=3075927 RepID=UPI0028F6C949|nr:SDR family NAD(P)-dependent oxidoreductase [Umezawaea sp. Da 62-37]WNV84006.1 SDR family NAD(P)-dependent oxidoreductase [Umezawaea sp. Da 62-37]
MSTVLITGSADGLGQMAAKLLLDEGHEVVLHARDEARAEQALGAVPGAAGVLTGDLSSIAEVVGLAGQANARGRFDAVIHNAGVYRLPERVETVDGLSLVFAVNVLAPYLLTALVERPTSLVYLSSGMHRGGDPDLSDLQWKRKPWQGSQAYSDSKLLDVALAFGVARRWAGVRSNAVDPGWVATKMGGPGAPDDLAQGPETQVRLAVDDLGSGGYYYHQRMSETHPAVSDIEVQEGLLAVCREITGVEMATT